jgi:hypothetical protein
MVLQVERKALYRTSTLLWSYSLAMKHGGKSPNYMEVQVAHFPCDLLPEGTLW